MRRAVSVGSLVVLSLGIYWTHAMGADRFPLPDPAERAAFQQEELLRRAAFERLRVQPPDARRNLQDLYDVTYYRLALDLRAMDAQWLSGDLRARVQVVSGPLEAILFDFSDTMQVDSAFVDGVPAAFTHEGYELRISPPVSLPTGQSAEVRVVYQGYPAVTGFEGFGWSAHGGGVPIVWSLSEPTGAREWWPCKDSPDDKADSIDVFIRVPDWIVATSNGLLQEKRDEGDKSYTFHWKHRYPITTYLVCVTATNYERIVDHYVAAPGDTMLIEHFVYPEKTAEAEVDLSITPKAITAFSTRFGPYPFQAEKYGHTLFPWGGAMEHQTNTSYGADLIRGDHRYDWILVHELSHQWWGDMVSVADWRDIWLSEGFASYAEALWAEHLGGPEAYRNYMARVQLVMEPSGPIYNPRNLFDGNTVYNKGSWVVHMLRGVLGDSLFFAALSEYRSRTAYRSTTTAELQSIVEDVAQQDLDWFFQPWIYWIDRPHYSYSYLPIGQPALPGIAIHLDQTRKGENPFFTMPVELQIDLEGGRSIPVRLMHDPDHLDLELDLPAPPVGVRVDPNGWILKTVEMVNYGLNITTTDLPDGLSGSSYGTQVHGRGGIEPYAWDVVDSLPPGITLDPLTGRLSGTAPDVGLYLFGLQLADGRDRKDTQRYRWTVTATPADTSGVEPPVPFSLKIYPVPARKWVAFSFASYENQPVTLSLYDLGGRLVRELWHGVPPQRPISWNGHDDRERTVGSGFYVARLSGVTGTTARHLVWLR